MQRDTVVTIIVALTAGLFLAAGIYVSVNNPATVRATAVSSKSEPATPESCTARCARENATCTNECNNPGQDLFSCMRCAEAAKSCYRACGVKGMPPVRAW